ncbi:hypothetical protein PspLS_04533 [Pyricularia sp. CBS 133598]|nr:hypothetical protein PspLS_04533 [Pyricularia sp. CBS 133598]
MSGSPSSPTSPANDRPQTPGEAGAADMVVNANGKRRLTEEEKRENHTRSEHKRRETIRGHFERICAIVPELDSSMSRSEAHVIVMSHTYIKELKARRRALVEFLRSKGVEIDDSKLRCVSNYLPNLQIAENYS